MNEELRRQIRERRDEELATCASVAATAFGSTAAKRQYRAKHKATADTLSWVLDLLAAQPASDVDEIRNVLHAAEDRWQRECSTTYPRLPFVADRIAEWLAGRAVSLPEEAEPSAETLRQAIRWHAQSVTSPGCGHDHTNANRRLWEYVGLDHFGLPINDADLAPAVSLELPEPPR